MYCEGEGVVESVEVDNEVDREFSVEVEVVADVVEVTLLIMVRLAGSVVMDELKFWYGR